VVTAQRREETANSVGMPIQAFSGETLQQLRVTDPKDLSVIAPSFTVSQSYQGVPTYTLRGIGFNTINLSATSTVGTYVDEVAYAYPFMNTGPIFDLERVEVLKGPQGTLYGRNTTAGLIDFVTNKPTETFEGSATAEFGNYQTHNFEGYVSGPLAKGCRAAGVPLGGQRRGLAGQQHARRAPGREPPPGLARRPGPPADRHARDRLLVFRLDQHVRHGGRPGDRLHAGHGGQPVQRARAWSTTSPPTQPTKASQADWAARSARGADIGTGLGIGGPAREDDRMDAGKLKVVWDLTDSVRLVSLTSYNELTRDAVFDWSGAPYEILVQKAHGEIESAAEELHFEGKTDKGAWLVGGYVAHDELLDSNRTLLGQNANVGTVRFFGSTLLATPFNSGGYTALQMSQAFRTYEDIGNIETDTWSLFANIDHQLTNDLKLTLGVRYSQDKQDYAGCSRDFNGNMLPNVNVVNRALFFAAYGLVAPISQGQCNTFDPVKKSFGLVTSTLDEDNLAWRVALDWKATEDVLLFGSISRGAKAGVTPINAANISTQNAPATQELLTAYEVGVKAACSTTGSRPTSAPSITTTGQAAERLFRRPDLYGPGAPGQRAQVERPTAWTATSPGGPAARPDPDRLGHLAAHRGRGLYRHQRRRPAAELRRRAVPLQPQVPGRADGPVRPRPGQRPGAERGPERPLAGQVVGRPGGQSAVRDRRLRPAQRQRRRIGSPTRAGSCRSGAAT
jgi:iron complex outermembrane receptor protein